MSIKKVPTGGYEVRYLTPNGKSRRKRCRTLEEARRFEVAVEHSKLTGGFVDQRLGKQTVGDAANAWLAAVRPGLKPKTLASYRSLIDSRIEPALGGRHLSRLKPSDVQTWINNMSEELSPSRVRQAHTVLRQALDTAMGDGAVGRNVALGAKLPRLQHHEAAYFEPPVVESIADAMPEPYDLLVRILGTVGLRWAEAVGLQRSHVDLLRRRVSVESSLSEVGGKFVRTTTKSHAVRSVPLPASLAAALAAHLDDRVAPETDALLFSGPRQHGPLRYRYFYMRLWRPTLERLGLPAGGLHILRHSAAAGMIAASASPKATQTVLGHRSVSFTLDTYGHIFEDDLDDLAARLDEARNESTRVNFVSTLNEAKERRAQK